MQFSELEIGNFVIVEFDGQLREGVVTHLNTDDKQVCVATDVQEFWYEIAQLLPVMINNTRLLQFGFEKKIRKDNTIKYSKGSFRIVLLQRNDFLSIEEMWYREDRRMHPNVRYMHQLQNHYLQMTKMYLVLLTKYI